MVAVVGRPLRSCPWFDRSSHRSLSLPCSLEHDRTARWGKRMSRGNTTSGFTLIELMVTIAVLAVVLAIAVPSFKGVIQSNRVATSTNEIIATLSLARSEAIRNSRGSGVCASADGSECGGNWGQGLMVWSDTNGDGDFDAADETVVRFVASHAQMDYSGAADLISFDGRGRRKGFDDFSIELQPKDCGEQAFHRSISVNPTGQIRTQKGTCK